MVELYVIRDLIAIFGVIAGFSYYVLTVRINQRTMRINLTNDLIQQVGTEDFIMKEAELMYMDWEDYDDFERKYGSDVDLENYAKRTRVWTAYDSLGMLLMEGLADKDILYNSQVVNLCIRVWNKYKDIIDVQRKLYSGSDTWKGFQYLAAEMYKMKLQRNPDWTIEKGHPRYDEFKKSILTE